MGKRLAQKIFNIFIIIAAVATVYYSYSYFKFLNGKNKTENRITKELSFMQKNEEEIKTLEYYKNYYSNNDIIGSLEIENTNIKTLLVKGVDNKYYLNHSLSKDYDIIGSIFVDYRVNMDSRQVNIYGHNSIKYNVIFKELENYIKKDYYNTHKYIKIWDGNKTETYEIFSVQIIKSDYEYYDVNPEDWNKHIRKLKKSIYDTEVEVSDKDDILTLQTCYFKPANSLLIINSRKVI